jgi:hypothetical protein
MAGAWRWRGGVWRWRGGVWRWCGGMATHGERGDEAMARAFKRWVRLTDGPSPLLI